MNFSQRRFKYWVFHPASLALLIGMMGIVAFAVLIFLIETIDSYRLGILVLTGLSIFLLTMVADYSFKIYRLLEDREER